MAGATEDPLNVTAADVAAPEKPAEEPEPAPEVVPAPAETVEPVTAAPETNGALPLDEEETEPFSDEIKYISRARPGGPKESPYAFVVVGEVYIPGYMVRQYTLHVRDWVTGQCKVATPNSRLPYRATQIDLIEPAAGSDAVPPPPAAQTNSNGYDKKRGNGRAADDEVLDHLDEYDAAMPRADDGESDTSEGNGQIVAQSLLEYIRKYKGEVRLAGPPQQPGCIAHFYHQDKSAAETIKAWQLADSKPGVQAFVRSFPNLFSVFGRHPNQKIFASDNAKPPGPAPAESSGKPASSANAPSSPGSAATAAAVVANGSPKGGKGEANGKGGGKGAGAAPLFSKAAMAASARAMAAQKAAPPPAPKQAALDIADLRDQLIELRADLHVAAAALTSAQQRMERLEISIEEGADK